MVLTKSSVRQGARRLIVMFVVGLAVAFVAPAAAEASYPGDNGRIAYGDNVASTPTTPHIWTVRPDGSHPKRLTGGNTFDACAAYSPDGQWIAYCKGTLAPVRHIEIWVMRANGEDQHPVTHLGGFAIFPDFSPSGRRIVFTLDTNDGSSDLWLVGAHGGNPHPLTITPGVSEDNAAWSPDGRRIAFLRGAPAFDTSQVWVRDMRTGRERQLTTGQPKDQLPDWSPDGRRIAYTARAGGGPAGGDIYIMNADGTNQHAVITGRSDDFAPTWSPDGKRIAFLRASPTSREVWIADADGTHRHVLHRSGGVQFAPAWQPVDRD
jgi:TolB protein